ncbi:ethanolamine ammonia-lyase reactivating factor EutA [Candidatus Saccharibacteria bacterium]|nr:ethanolamine ammonia-lyase reactivating factor EutA [Candidatus Saccharibacteria bacterium]
MLDKIHNLKDKVLSARPAKKDDSQYLVGLDIGTEFVKALIGKVTEDGIQIVGVGRAHQELNDMQAGAISDISAVVNNCDSALSQAEAQAGVSTKSAVLGIAGELVKGTTTTVHCNRKHADKELDIEEVEQIISLVQERAKTRAKDQLVWELGGKDVEIRLVNSALVNIEIDGYPVTNPVGFKGREVVVQLYTAFAPMIHIGALERTAKELDLELIAVAAEPFAVSRSVIGDDANASMSAILMDVGGGTTDIAVVNDGGVQGTKMFGIGGRAYTKSIEREMSVSFLQAEELKLGLSNHKLAESKVKSVEAALKKTLDVWTSGVELALAEFDQLDHLPRRILLCGGGSSLDMLMHRLESSDWYSELPFTRKPVVQHIKPSHVVGISDKTGTVTDHTMITAMGLLRVGLDTIQQDVPNANDGTIRQKIDKMLRV